MATPWETVGKVKWKDKSASIVLAPIGIPDKIE